MDFHLSIDPRSRQTSVSQPVTSFFHSSLNLRATPKGELIDLTKEELADN